MTQPKKQRGKPAWVAHRLGVNLGKKHADMLEQLIANARKEDSRATVGGVIEDAIDALHFNTFGNGGEE